MNILVIPFILGHCSGPAAKPVKGKDEKCKYVWMLLIVIGYTLADTIEYTYRHFSGIAEW